jgi:hypothetical protein
VHGVGPDVGTSAFLSAAKDQPALFESLIVGSGDTSADTTGATLKDLIFAPTLADLEKLDGAVVALSAIDSLLNQELPTEVRADYAAASAGRRFVEAFPVTPRGNLRCELQCSGGCCCPTRFRHVDHPDGASRCTVGRKTLAQYCFHRRRRDSARIVGRTIAQLSARCGD